MAIIARTQRPLTEFLLVLAAGLVLGPSGGCDDASIREQRIAKGIEVVPKAPTSADAVTDTAAIPAGASAADEHGDRLATPAWTIPSTWEFVPGERPMRFATFRSPGPAAADATEIAVSVFPGRVGGELANINRWRTQMGNAPVEPGELESIIERFAQPGFAGYRAAITGDSGVMLATGLYETARDRTWFIRAVAAPESADRIAAEIAAFAESFSAGPAADATNPDGEGG